MTLKFFNSTFLISNFLFLILLASCSIQQKISKSARQLVLKDSSLLTAHIGISIYEPEAGKYWFNYQSDKYFVPASNTKIPTCYAAMKYLGDSLVGFKWMQVDTMINVFPTADPGFLHPDFSSERTINFLKGFKNVSLQANGFFTKKLGNGWSWNDYQASYMVERSSFPMYGNLVKFYIKDDWVKTSPPAFEKMISLSSKRNLNGIRVNRSRDSNEYLITKGEATSVSIPFSTSESTFVDWLPSLQAKLLSDTLKIPVSVGLSGVNRPDGLKTYYSQATDSLLKIMMHRSDNFFAEQSLLMVSSELFGAMSEEMTIDSILQTDFKDLPQRPSWADGSGLSRYNLFTPQDFVFILNKMKNEFGMERLKVIFPTGGKGTITNYYKADSSFIFAKTGTLSGVVALSGFLYSKKGKLLIFSTLVNNHQASSVAVRRAVEKFLQGVRDKY